MQNLVRKQLYGLIDPGHQKFSSKLLPTTNNILGIRLLKLRKIAKKITKDDWRKYLVTAEDEYFEEIMLQGMVIGSIEADIEEILPQVALFIPKIDN